MATTSKKIHLDSLKDILVSKDETLLETNKWIFEGESKYLELPKEEEPIVVYATFFRTGNTFLRKYLESITGVVTGSDMKSSISMSIQLEGLKGE